MLKTFKDENNLPERLFLESIESKNIDGNYAIILLDDFVGEGSFFLKWYESKKAILEKFGATYFAVLAGFEEGLDAINKAGIQTICSKVYDKSFKVLEGNQFTAEEKERIKHLIDKYSDSMPKDYLWGRDDCQLLIAFYSNIPNNSLAILWSSIDWTPLIQRK